MERCTKQQRVIIVKTYYAETGRKLRRIFFRESEPNLPTIRRMVKNLKKLGRLWTVRLLCVNVPVGLLKTLLLNPETSIRHRSQQLHILRSTTQRILTKGPTFIRTKFNLPRRSNQQIMKAPVIRSMGNGASDVNGFVNTQLVEFGAQKILMQSMSNKYTHNEQLSGADFGQVA